MNATRLDRVRAAMKAASLDALFLSNPKNVQYVTGFKPMMPGDVQPFGDPEGFALIHSARCDLLCDGRYITGASKLSGVTAQQIESPTNSAVFAKKVMELLPAGAKRVGFEQDALLYCDATGLLKEASKVDWHPAEEIMASIRVRKEPDEIELIRKAQAITGDCFKYIAGTIKPGMSERQVALAIGNYLRENSDGNSFDPIVAFGETSCNPHYLPSPTRKLERNQLVLLDFGGIYQGYCGDLTRMIFMGKADARTREVYGLVLEAQKRCLDGIRPGKTCHELDALCRDYFTSKGCADAFQHGTGHGVGLAIHEDPRLKKTIQKKIAAGMAVTVEPGLYYAGWGGIRIEDLVVVTETGHDNLTTVPKELLELSV